MVKDPAKAEKEATKLPYANLLKSLEDKAGPALERPSALILLGYLTARKEEMPANVAGFAIELRGKPWIWSALVDLDVIRISRALDMYGLPVVSAAELQKAKADLEQVLAVAA